MNEWLKYWVRKWLGLATLDFRFQAHLDNLHYRPNGNPNEVLPVCPGCEKVLVAGDVLYLSSIRSACKQCGHNWLK